ncbi:nucleotidyltransferase [Paenibacillus thermoaerophilus]|uniref:tRNA(Met) cytidine acetate ligase n=1 Tax=Paenibacillus thermoaerophilus TaxID=1215385 RepID=A0ABW2UXZ9_9BACL|nr:nucleotidyltransferase [Paenibacillus thermoaerophilus]TMV19174.1 nucleotidyltransferase [Paenibacillus thermoaerophilus]
MRAVGLIVEYNPLHNGHVYHCRESRRLSGADAVVCVMSGHFLQRGEPALANKWARTEMALRMGADLVLELPVAYACQPAEWFAYGAVSVLDATGCVDALCFGSESGDLRSLDAAAGVLASEPPSMREDLRTRLKSGVPYPAAYAGAAAEAIRRQAEDAGAEAPDLSQPNNSLGLHYLLALRRLRSRIEPLTIPRLKAGYLQREITDESIASATALRRLLGEGADLDALKPYVPASTLDVLRSEWRAGRAPMSWDRFAGALFHELYAADADELALRFDVREGIENRLKQALAGGGFDPHSPGAVDRLLDALKTKRYTRTALQRMLLRILLHHRKSDLPPERLAAGAPYIRVLGFTGRGRELLKRMRRTARVPVVVRAAASDDPWLAMDIRASAVYALAYPRRQPDAVRWDYTRPPLQLDR